jgi:hypothetical protein
VAPVVELGFRLVALVVEFGFRLVAKSVQWLPCWSSASALVARVSSGSRGGALLPSSGKSVQWLLKTCVSGLPVIQQTGRDTSALVAKQRRRGNGRLVVSALVVTERCQDRPCRLCAQVGVCNPCSNIARLWRRYVPPKRRLLQEPHGVTSQKTALFIVTAVKGTNLKTYMALTGSIADT